MAKAGHPTGYWLHQQGVLWLFHTSVFSRCGLYTHTCDTHTEDTVDTLEWKLVSSVFPYMHKYTSFCLITRFKDFPRNILFTICFPKSFQATCRCLIPHLFILFFIYFLVVYSQQIIISLRFSFSSRNSCVFLLKCSSNADVPQSGFRLYL